MLMNLLRKLSIGTMSALIKFSLLACAIVFAFVGVMGDSTGLKEALSQGRIYDHVVDAVAEAMSKEQPGEQKDTLNLNQPEVIQIAKSSFTPEILRKGTETIIDSSYQWLDGSTAKPAFTVDLNEPKNQFVQGVGDYYAARLQSLPACSREQSLHLARQGSINLLSVNCQPSVISIEAEKQRLINQLGSQEGFLGDPVLTEESIRDKNGKPIRFEDNRLPAIFQTLQKAPLLLVLVFILSAAGLITLSKNKQAGLHSVLINVAGTGLFLLVITLILTYLFNSFNRPDGALGREFGLPSAFQAAALDSIRYLFANLSAIVLRLALVYVAAGGVGLLIMHRGQFKHKEAPVKEMSKS